MKYEEARDHIQDGDIIFLRGKRTQLINRIIMYFTSSPYSHVGIAVWMNKDNQQSQRLLMVESQLGTKNRIINLSEYSSYAMDVVPAPIEWRMVRDTALSSLGISKYSVIDAIFVGLREWFHKFFVIPYANLSDGEICSEFVSRIYNLKPQNVSPGLLKKILEDAGYSTRFNITK